MLRFTVRRHYLGANSAGGAGASWFGKSQATDTWWGCAKSMIACLCGIAVINVFVRGNPLGHAATENDIYVPETFRRRSLPETPGYGFVSDDDDSGRTHKVR